MLPTKVQMCDTYTLIRHIRGKDNDRGFHNFDVIIVICNTDINIRHPNCDVDFDGITPTSQLETLDFIASL